MAKMGAHVSAAGSLDLSFDRAKEIGAECVQFFISPPQQWAKIEPSRKEVKRCCDMREETGISPNFIHGAYLINLASSDPLNLQKSIDWLIYSQTTAIKLGIEGTIFHIGSSGTMDRKLALRQVIRAISTILQAHQVGLGAAKLILETSAGAGNTIGDEFSELGRIIKEINDERLKICLDTQHVFASGYDIRTKEGLEKVLEEFDRKIGLDKLICIHLNDSKTGLGSHRDRHENLGDGLIGLDAFRNIVNHLALKDIPFILEVPGEGRGPDKNNLDRLKSLIIARKPGFSKTGFH